MTTRGETFYFQDRGSEAAGKNFPSFKKDLVVSGCIWLPLAVRLKILFFVKSKQLSLLTWLSFLREICQGISIHSCVSSKVSLFYKVSKQFK